MKGIIIKSTGSWYKIKQADGSTLDARVKGKFRLKDITTTNPLAVGDVVEYEMEPSGDDVVGIIHKLEKRQNYIIRKSNKLSKQGQIIAANIDIALLIVTLSSPRTSLGFIDRFLVMAGAYHIPVTLIFNKVDIYTQEEEHQYQNLKKMYESLGNQTAISSIYKTELLPEFSILPLINNKTALLCGHSGVGKSSILNSLMPLVKQKVDKISKIHLKGKHTTTFAEMFYLEDSIAIIDTPGIRDFGVIDIPENEIGHYFTEIRALMPKCKFNDCKHLNEPECAVIEAFEKGEILPSRYLSYMSIMENSDIFD